MERNLITIGEAAMGVPESVTQRFSDIPWRRMRKLRNFVVHEYWGVDFDRIWDTIFMDLSPLVAMLERVIEEGPEDET